MKKVKVIMNEQHKLMEEQIKILNERFGESWEIYPVPEKGWSLEEMKRVYEELKSGYVIVFASPIPYLIMKLAHDEGYYIAASENPLYGATYTSSTVLIFHNDKREKKELPNGRIVHVVAQTGWQLVQY